jgi:hypothetical protein
MMRRLLTILFCLILLSAKTIAQSAASPDAFQGLVLNETTLDDVKKALGNSDTDKTDSLDVSKIGKWLDPKHKEKVFRKLSYKSREFSKIELSFFDDKLVMIDLTFKKSYDAEKISNLFAVRFALLGGPASLPDEPGKYPVPFIATHFPPYYSLVAISEKTFLYVNCISGGGGSSPGIVERTRQISRTLQKK